MLNLAINRYFHWMKPKVVLHNFYPDVREEESTGFDPVSVS